MEEECHLFVYKAALESDEVTSIVCDKTIGNIKMCLTFQIHKGKESSKRKSIVDSGGVWLKAKEIQGHVTWGQESVKAFLASAGWLMHFRRPCGIKLLNLQVKQFLQAAAKLFKNVC